jgi:hypothetical protein
MCVIRTVILLSSLSPPIASNEVLLACSCSRADLAPDSPAGRR